MADRAMQLIEADLEESRTVLDAAAKSQEFRDSVRGIAAAWSACLKVGGKIMLAGNGGSAGGSQHIAGDLVSRLNYDRAPVAGIALTTDTSILTAIGKTITVTTRYSRVRFVVSAARVTFSSASRPQGARATCSRRWRQHARST